MDGHAPPQEAAARYQRDTRRQPCSSPGLAARPQEEGAGSSTGPSPAGTGPASQGSCGIRCWDEAGWCHHLFWMLTYILIMLNQQELCLKRLLPFFNHVFLGENCLQCHSRLIGNAESVAGSTASVPLDEVTRSYHLSERHKRGLEPCFLL